jgi:F-type H+-transporting ATPase subunit b
MDPAILDALRDYFLGAIPTIVLVLLTTVAYNFMVYRPLNSVLDQRRERTAGALARAQADIAAAEQKAAEYERRLREARQTTFKAQEARRKQILQARDAALSEARIEADVTMRAAQVELEKEKAEAKVRLQAEADKLANEVIRTILKPVAAAPASGGSQ